jgi:hypothetical protein
MTTNSLVIGEWLSTKICLKDAVYNRRGGSLERMVPNLLNFLEVLFRYQTLLPLGGMHPWRWLFGPWKALGLELNYRTNGVGWIKDRLFLDEENLLGVMCDPERGWFSGSQSPDEKSRRRCISTCEDNGVEEPCQPSWVGDHEKIRYLNTFGKHSKQRIVELIAAALRRKVDYHMEDRYGKIFQSC